MDFEETKARNLINQMNQRIPKQSVISPIGTEQPVCPQCGLIHPPLRPGEKCPNAPIQSGEKKIDTSKFFASLKNICVSQIEKKGIKDVEKLFNNLVIEVTKYLENYEE